MTVTVIPNMTRSAAYEVTSAVLDELSRMGCPVLMEPALEAHFGARDGLTYTPNEQALTSCDVVLSVGVWNVGVVSNRHASRGDDNRAAAVIAVYLISRDGTKETLRFPLVQLLCGNF